MLRVLEVTLPVFALVFCGFFGQRWQLLPKQAVQGINAFVFYFALPAMLFRIVATQSLSGFADWRFVAGYAGSTLAIFLFTRTAALPARTGTSEPDRAPEAASTVARSQATVFGLNTAHGNIGYLGMPLALELGHRYVPSMILALVCDIFLVITLAIALLELDRRRRGAGRGSAERSVALTVILGLVRSPLVFSIALGFVWALLERPMPSVVDNFTRILGGAAGPCALFAIGASLGDRRIRVDRTIAGLMMIKLVAHPALAALLLFGLFKASPHAAAIGVLAASLPSASNTFIIAERYRLDSRAISAAILLGTFLSLASVSFVIWVLGLRS